MIIQAEPLDWKLASSSAPSPAGCRRLSRSSIEEVSALRADILRGCALLLRVTSGIAIAVNAPGTSTIEG
jgi:hypothetical protein